MTTIRALLATLFALVSWPALADFAFTAGSGQTMFTFTCFTTKHCSAHVPINSAGAELFTSGNPGYVTDAAVGATGDAASSAGGTGSLSAKLRLMTTQLDNINTNVQGSIPAGTALIGKVGIDQTTPGTTNNVTVSYGSTALVADPCQSNAKSYVPISQTTSTQLFAGTSAKKTYVCHVFVLANAAETVMLVSGTGTVCATNPHAMIGSASVTALSALSANGGFSLGNGGYAIAASTTNADNVCLVQVGSAQLTGVISYVSQ